MSEVMDSEVTTISVREEPANNPMALLSQAVANGLDASQLKALVDLQEQYRAARAKEAFAEAMNLCQSEMPCIVRDAENKQTNSRYVRLETVTHNAKPIYGKHGFSLSFSEAECPTQNFKRTVCLVRHREGHSESHYIDLPLDGFSAKGNPIGAMNPVQAAISTGTYAQRILTCRVFDITIADTDLDGNRPAYDNPNESRAQSRPAPRGQRTAPEAPPPEVSAQQLAHVVAHWKAKNTDPDGNLVRQEAAFKQWAIETTSRSSKFNPRRQAEWTREDYEAACKALGIEVLE